MHSTNSSAKRTSGGSVTCRATLVGLVGAVGLNVLAVMAYIESSADFCSDYCGAGIVIVFALICVGNLMVRQVREAWALERRELVVVFIMVLVSGAIPTEGLCGFFVRGVVAPFYSSDKRMIEEMLPRIPTWLAPQGDEPIRWFFDGMPHGASIPWDAWVVPLFFWLLFILSLYFVSLCVLVVLRKQWVQHERLAYPVARLGVEMVEGQVETPDRPSIYRNGFLWLGAAVPTFFHAFQALNAIWPTVPFTKLCGYRVAGLGIFNVWWDVNFPVIGFSYFISLDVAFSLWFFYLFCTAQNGIFTYLGVLPEGNDVQSYSRPPMAHQCAGGLIVLVIAMLWIARKQIWIAVREVVAPSSPPADEDEVLPYRVAVIGAVVGFLFLAKWLQCAGMSFWCAFGFMLAVFILLIALTRAVTQAGIIFVKSPMLPAMFMLRTIGAKALGPDNVAWFAHTMILFGDTRAQMMPFMANGLKLAEVAGPGKRRLAWVMGLVVVACFAAAFITLVYNAYTRGANNCRWILSPQLWGYGQTLSQVKNPTDVNPLRLVFTCIGALFTLFLMWMQKWFAWWPFHPIGFVFSTNYGIARSWLGIFIGWLIKLTVLKVGGLRLYKSYMPFFIGLILGEFISAGAFGALLYFGFDVQPPRFWPNL